MPFGFGYHVINTLNGKLYAGQTCDLEGRWSSHLSDARRGAGFYLHSAIRKYGENAFRFVVVFEANSQDELNTWEIAEIARLDLTNPAVGYNLTHGGEGGQMSPIAYARHAAACSAPEYKAKQSADSIARWEDPDYKERVGIGQRANWAANRDMRAAAIRAGTLAYWPNVFVEGQVFSTKADADHMLNLTSGTTSRRVASDKKRWCGWFDVENHNDPELDDAERVSAIKRWHEAQQSLPEDIPHTETLEWKTVHAEARKRPEYKAKQKASRAKPEYKAIMAVLSAASNDARSPNVFADGLFFRAMKHAEQHFGFGQGTARYRINSPRFRWWFTIPNHNDPACDAVEETWAIMQWAKENPDHPNVPDWARPDRPKHGVAPAWAQQRPSKAA